MTTKPGSWRPLSWAAMVAAGMPRITARAMAASRTRSKVCGAGCRPQATAAQSRRAATEPQVPGPGLPRPAPKKVATVQAQKVLRAVPATTVEAGLLVIGVSSAAAEVAEIFEDFWVQNRRADLVDAHGPFAKVDFAAAVRAEREVLVFQTDQHAAGGTAKEFYGFFLGSHLSIPLYIQSGPDKTLATMSYS